MHTSENRHKTVWRMGIATLGGALALGPAGTVLAAPRGPSADQSLMQAAAGYHMRGFQRTGRGFPRLFITGVRGKDGYVRVELADYPSTTHTFPRTAVGRPIAVYSLCEIWHSARGSWHLQRTMSEAQMWTVLRARRLASHPGNMDATLQALEHPTPPKR